MHYFSPFRFDADQGTLWRGPDRVRLTPKASALLKCLIGARGSWLSKPAIMAAVWPTTHVQPDNIKVLVREIRQALGDSPMFPRFISSWPRRGYAFIAPLAEDDHPAGTPQPSGTGPFVGRVQERAMLAAALAAVRGRTPQMVLVSGEQGLGKSALCDAFLRDARATGPVRSCLGQCFERQSASEPYSPILDALLRLDRRHEGLVAPALARHAPSWLTHFPQWSRSSAASTRTATRRARVFPPGLDALAAAFEAMCDDVPLVLVIEDLQWADADTLHALVQLAAHPRARLLVIGTYSDGEWIAGRRLKHRLTAHPRTSIVQLRTLSVDEMRQYLDARFGVGGVPDLASVVHQAAAGNPKLARIGLDRLVAAGLVSSGSDGRRCDVGRETIARAMREAIAESVSEQLDHLDPRERELLEAAAVAGRAFSAAQLAFALGMRAEDARQRLAAMARRGHLIVAAGPESARLLASVYRFRQPLYAEVIAQRAPMVRQLHTLERLGSRRALERRRA